MSFLFYMTSWNYDENKTKENNFLRKKGFFIKEKDFYKVWAHSENPKIININDIKELLEIVDNLDNIIISKTIDGDYQIEWYNDYRE